MTITVIVLTPTVNAIGPEASPESTLIPSTLTIAPAALVVGVTVTEGTAKATAAEYVSVLPRKPGLKETTPAEPVNTSSESVASDDGTL